MVTEDKDIFFSVLSTNLTESYKNFNAELDKNLFYHRLMATAVVIVTGKVKCQKVKSLPL